MKIFSIKSPLFWIILVLVVFAVAGGFWYIKTPFEKIELSEVVLNSEWDLEEVEIILAGEVPDKDLFMEEETSPLEVKKSIKKELPVAVSKEPELLISDSTEDEEEIVFNCETGNDVQEE